jgi:hypothetical protein
LSRRTLALFHSYCRAFAARITARISENIQTLLFANISARIAGLITACLIFNIQLPRICRVFAARLP